jgi:heat shock protein HslJ
MVGACSTPETPPANANANSKAESPSYPTPAAQSQSQAQLENTYWKLMTLNGDAVVTPEGAREIQFVLHQEGHRVAGFSGCNQMMGAYQVENDKITFSQMGGTRMFCENTMDIETRVHQMFAAVAAWKISGESLALIDAGGQTIATFESRYMK